MSELDKIRAALARVAASNDNPNKTICGIPASIVISGPVTINITSADEQQQGKTRRATPCSQTLREALLKLPPPGQGDKTALPPIILNPPTYIRAQIAQDESTD